MVSSLRRINIISAVGQAVLAALREARRRSSALPPGEPPESASIFIVMLEGDGRWL